MSFVQKRNAQIFPKPFAGIKSFCKVCHDAGKSESEYTSHFVKSEPGLKGVVVCPTLLAQPCIYCNKPGHTVSYCEVLKKQKDAQERGIRTNEFKNMQNMQNKKTENKPKKNTRFSALVEDVGDVKDVAVEDVKDFKLKRKLDEAFPALCENRAPASVWGISYANVAAKPPAPIPEKKCEIPILIDKYIESRNNSKRWADWSDSDSEEEETYNVNLR